MLFEFAILVALGASCMLMATISGGGSNVILIPALILAFHFAPGEAIGTSFLALTIGSIVSGMRFFRKGYLDLKRGVVLGLAVVPGVLAGSIFSFFAEDRTFKILLGLVVIILSILMIVRNRLAPKRSPEDSHSGEQSKKFVEDYEIDLKIGAVLMAAIGVFVGFFGQGGGLVLVPTMQFLGFPVIVALGTARFISIFLGATSFFTRLAADQVDITAGIALAIGTVIGGFLGVEFSSSLRADVMRWIVAIMIAILGVLLLIESL